MKPIRMDVFTPDGVETTTHESIKNAKRHYNRIMKKYGKKLKRVFTTLFMLVVCAASALTQPGDKKHILVTQESDGRFYVTQVGYDSSYQLCLKIRHYFNSGEVGPIQEHEFTVAPGSKQYIPFDVSSLEPGIYSLDWSTEDQVFDFFVIEKLPQRRE